MRSRILVVARDVALRERLARLLNDAAYRVEIAESIAHARRNNIKGLALAVVATDGYASESRASLEELARVTGKLLLFIAPGSRQVLGADLFDATDEDGLLARVAEALKVARDTEPSVLVLKFAGFTLDITGHSLLSPAGHEIVLTRSEFGLLREFVQRAGRVLSRDQLLQALAGRDAETFDRSVDMLVVRLRRKIEPNPKHPSLILTVPGSGYKFTAKVFKVESALPKPELFVTLPETARAAPERRYVTVLTAEILPIEGTSFSGDPEELRAPIDAFRRYVAIIIAKYGGVIVERRMREVLAYFGYPVAHEYATDRAIYAGLALTEHLGDTEVVVPAGFAVRVGVSSGLVVIDSTGEMLGESPNVATRLLNFVEPGQVVITAETKRILGDLFAYREFGLLPVKGVVSPVHAWRVLGPNAFASRSEVLYSAILTPLVGREEELGLMLHSWQRAKSGEGRLVLLSGEPGIGKSRLLAAFEEAFVPEPRARLRHFCSPLHQDSALHPIITNWRLKAGFVRGDSAEARLLRLEALFASLETPPEDCMLIAAMLAMPTGDHYPHLDLSPQRRKERTFAALHRWLVSLAKLQPVLIVFEDVQWADPSSLELLNKMVDLIAKLPILLVISYRPEFVPPWTSCVNVRVISLSRLDQRESSALVGHIAAGHALTPALLSRIVTRTDGVPLFIEELTKVLLEASERSDDIALSLDVPSTLQTSLMARLDWLPAAKLVAQIGAVIGRDFSHVLLVAVAGMSEVSLLLGLNELLVSDLVFRRGVPPETFYVFKHALVRDTAYESLLKSRRIEIHAAVVAAAERDSLLAIEPSIVAHHCAQAGLIAKAAYYYCIAGQRSIEQVASFETSVQLERGLEFATTLADGPGRYRLEAELLLALGRILEHTKGNSHTEAGRFFERAIPVCRSLGSPDLLARALRGRFRFLLHRGDPVTAQAVAEDLLKLSELCCKAWVGSVARTILGISSFFQGCFVIARQHLEIALETGAQGLEQDLDFVTKSDWRVEALASAYLAQSLACLGYPEQAEKQVRASDRASQITTYWSPVCTSLAGFALIILHDVTDLRERVIAQISLCDERGYPHYLATSRSTLGWLEAREGQRQRGLDMLRDGLAELRDLGIIIDLPFFQGLEADALACNGRQFEALTIIDDALDLSHSNNISWFNSELHRRRGEIMIKQNDVNLLTVEQEFLSAIKIARAQSAKLFELRAATSLARLWMDQGKLSDARDLLAPLHAWFTEGFDTTDMKIAKSLLDGGSI